MAKSAGVRGRNYLKMMAAEISIAAQPRSTAFLTVVMDGCRVEGIGTCVDVYWLQISWSEDQMQLNLRALQSEE